MPSLRALAVGVVVLIALVGCKTQAHSPIAAPPFELKDLSGKTVSLASLRGHPVLLDFWATWCGPCQMSIPLVQKFYMEHKDEGLVVLGLNMDDEASGVYPFVKQFKMTYPVLYASGTPVAEEYRVEGIPLFILIDAEGRIVRRWDGFRFDMANDWEHEYAKLTAKPLNSPR